MSDLREEQRAAMSDLREEQRAASSAPVSWLVLRDGDIQPVLDELSAQSEPVYLVDLRWASEPADSPSPVEDGAAIAMELLNTVKSLPAGQPARYFIVTQRAEVLDADAHDPAIDRAVLLGVSRTLISERFDLGVTLVDIDRPFEDTDELLQVLSRVGDEQEIALRDGKLLCARIDRVHGVKAVQQEESQTLTVSPGTTYALELKNTGSLDDIAFTPCERGTVGADEVEIEAEYVPLNYKDVLKAMGLMSDRITKDTYSGSGVGMEVAGRICRVGRMSRALRSAIASTPSAPTGSGPT